MAAAATLVLCATATPASASPPAASAGASPALGGFTVRPATFDPSDPATRSYFRQVLAGGSSWSAQVVVGNVSAHAVTLFVSAVDGLTGQTSGAVYANRQDPVRKAGTWVTVDTPSITVAPDSQLPVGFTVRVPAGAPAGDHLAGLAFENANPQTSGGGFRITEVVRTVVGVLVTVPGATTFHPEVFGARVAQLDGPGVGAVIVTLGDVGLSLGKPVLTVSLSGPHGYRRTLTRTLDTLLPGDVIDYPFAWVDDLAAGHYDIAATITGGGSTMTFHGSSALGSALKGAKAARHPAVGPHAAGGMVAWWVPHRRGRGQPARRCRPHPPTPEGTTAEPPPPPPRRRTPARPRRRSEATHHPVRGPTHRPREDRRCPRIASCHRVDRRTHRPPRRRQITAAGTSRRLAPAVTMVVLAAAFVLVGHASPAAAAALVSPAWSVTNSLTGASAASYMFAATTATSATLTALTMTVPSGTAGTAAVGTVSGLGSGTASLAGTTLTYAVTTPAVIGAGVALSVQITGLTNTATVGSYQSTITTKASGGAIDTGATNALVITSTPTTAYAANYIGGTLSPINTATKAVGSTMSATAPSAIAITPDGKTAYVANWAGTVTPITLATKVAGTPITVGLHPNAIAITPDGTMAFTANYGSGANSVTPINLTTNTAGAAIAVGTGPYAIAITPDGKTAYVANYNNDTGTTVTPITVATKTAGTPIRWARGPPTSPFPPTAPPPTSPTTGATRSPPSQCPPTPSTPRSPPPACPRRWPSPRTARSCGWSTTPRRTRSRPSPWPPRPPARRSRSGACPTPSPSPPTAPPPTCPSTTTAAPARWSRSLATRTVGAPISVGNGPDDIAVAPDQAPVAAFTVTPWRGGVGVLLRRLGIHRHLRDDHQLRVELR